MENKFKVGTSVWELTFESGEIIVFDTVLKESSTVTASGKSSVKLENATFNTEFLDLFKQDARISNINQKFKLINSNGGVIEELEYNYPNMKIKNITITGEVKNSGVEKVMFASSK